MPFILLRGPFFKYDLQPFAGGVFKDRRDQIARLAHCDKDRPSVPTAIGSKQAGAISDVDRRKRIRIAAGLIELFGALKNKDEIVFGVPVLFGAFDKSESLFPRFPYDRCFGNPEMFRFATLAFDPVAQGSPLSIDNRQITARLQSSPYRPEHLSRFGEMVVHVIHINKVRGIRGQVGIVTSTQHRPDLAELPFICLCL